MLGEIHQKGGGLVMLNTGAAPQLPNFYLFVIRGEKGGQLYLHMSVSTEDSNYKCLILLDTLLLI